MRQFYNSKEIKAQVPIVSFLTKLGYNRAEKIGNELYYFSMLREENTPSFCVNDTLDVWYDHGGPNRSNIKGGNIIDLALALWYPAPFNEVIERITALCQADLSPISELDKISVSRPRKAVKIPNYRILEFKSLGNNSSITNYLMIRGIWKEAANFLKEVNYYIEDEKKLRKHFFAAGWLNENEGYEVSTRCFKGCLGRKGITFLPGNAQKLVVFEAMMDYLSWRIHQKDNTPTAIILNGIPFIEAAARRAKEFTDVTLYLDLDVAGISAKDRFIGAIPWAKDGSMIYSGFKDYNEWLLSKSGSPGFTADVGYKDYTSHPLFICSR